MTTDEGPWRCFHCGDLFITRETAAEHFGTGDFEREDPVCVEAATRPLQELVAHSREMWKRLRVAEDQLEQVEHERDCARSAAARVANYEEVEGRALAAEAALRAGPRWLARLLRWNAERRWRTSRARTAQLAREAEALMMEKML